jgi:hypothetical protein
MVVFQFYLQSEKQKNGRGPSQVSKMGGVGCGCHVVFGQKFPVKQEV